MLARAARKSRSGARVECQNLIVHHLLKLLLVDAQGRAQHIVMVLAEGIEVLAHDAARHLHMRCGRLALELQLQALLQARRGDARRVELAHHVEHLLHLLGFHLHAVVERHIVGDGLRRALQPSVAVEVADDALGNDLLGGG